MAIKEKSKSIKKGFNVRKSKKKGNGVKKPKRNIIVLTKFLFGKILLGTTLIVSLSKPYLYL